MQNPLITVSHTQLNLEKKTQANIISNNNRVFDLYFLKALLRNLDTGFCFLFFYKDFLWRLQYLFFFGATLPGQEEGSWEKHPVDLFVFLSSPLKRQRKGPHSGTWCYFAACHYVFKRLWAKYVTCSASSGHWKRQQTCVRNLPSIFILLFKLKRGWSGSFHFLRGNALGLVSKSPTRTVASHYNDLSDWSNFLVFQRIEGMRGNSPGDSQVSRTVCACVTCHSSWYTHIWLFVWLLFT